MNRGETHHSSSSTAPIYDAVIVGAGPAGSSAASALASQGWHVLLLERDEFPRHKVCGEFLSPEAQGTLQSLGLYEAIAALDPVLLEGGRVTARKGRTLNVNLPGCAWGISRYAMDAALAAAAEQRGVEVRTGTTVTRWQETDSGFSVELRTGEGDTTVQSRSRLSHVTVQARSLLMACGRHVAKGLLPGVSARHRRKPRKQNVGVKCHFANLSMPAQVEVYLFPGGYAGINPVEDGRANVCLLASYETFARAGRSPSGLIAAAARWNRTFAERIHNAQPLQETERSVAPVDTRRRGHAWDGVPLLGDTAAMIPPLFGDGMAMALRSAELCVPLVDSYLRGDFSWQELGEQYNNCWHDEFDQRLRIGRMLERALLRPTTTKLLLKTGAKLPLLADYLVRATRGSVRKRDRIRPHLRDSR